MRDYIRVYAHNETAFTGGGLGVAENARDVCVKSNINGEYSLTFSLHPADKKARLVQEENICVVQGQRYRIKTIDGGRVTAEHIYMDAGRKHIQRLDDMIGAAPRDIMVKIFEDTPIQVLPPSGLPNGMAWVEDLTDFFECSKLTPLGALKNLMEMLDKYKVHNELYVDNYSIALVKQIGVDRGARLDTAYNAKELKVTRDTTELITRLYPYGTDDLHIGSANGGTQYIQSENYDKWPVEGYQDFDEIDDPQELKAAAELLFDAENPDRIDIPKYSITAQYAQRRDREIRLGDVVTVVDRDYGLTTSQRVVGMETYPFESSRNTITVGKPPTSAADMFGGVVSAAVAYNGTTNSRGSVKPQWLENIKTAYSTEINKALDSAERENRRTVIHDYGDIWVNPDNPNQALAIVGGVLAMANGKNPDGDWNWSAFGDWSGFTADVINTGVLNTALVNVLGSNGRLKIADNLLTIEDSRGKPRLQAGLSNGEYVFRLLDSSGNIAAEIDSDGDLVCYNANIKGELDTTAEGGYGYRIYDNTIVGIDRTGSEEKRRGLRTQIDEYGTHLELFVDDQPGLNIIVDKSGTGGKLCAKYCVDNPNNISGGDNATWIVFESEGTASNSKTKMYGGWNVADANFIYETPSMSRTAVEQRRIQIGNEYYWIRNGLLFPGN